ncbi:universal stress protein [Streptomyces sp. NPDC048338]|uniref:universal stress protein n=1 Tax=Streptomyces sp. NPDC048338 TaxID=3365536 RepID=UPI00371BD45A
MNAPVIVVGLNTTANSAAAAEWAAEEGVSRGATVCLVHIQEPRRGIAPEGRRTDAEAVLSNAADGLCARHAGLTVTTRLMTGSPAARLVRAAGEGDLLVLGSRALGDIAGFLLGSVLLTVVGRVERPLVVVRAPGVGRNLRTVLIGLNLREPYDPALAFGFETAARHQQDVHLVYAEERRLPVPAGIGGPAGRTPVAPELQHLLDEHLAAWRSRYPEVKITGWVAEGSPTVELLRAASSADLVVVGKHTRRPARGAHIGRLTHTLLRHSPAPVAIVPHG